MNKLDPEPAALKVGEYRPDRVGPKGYNRKLLKEKAGKKADVPNSVNIPFGVFEEVLKSDKEAYDKYKELVEGLEQIKDKKIVASRLEELQDLIEHRSMNFAVGNIFKACYRLGTKNDNMYDLNKIKWFVEREIARVKHGE